MSLLSEPTFVNDAELQDLLDLRVCSPNERGPPTNNTVLYIRSLAFLKHEFLHVLNDLAEKGNEIPKAKTWLKLLEDKPDHQAFFLSLLRRSRFKIAMVETL